jgi:hypothetical protein
LYLHCPLGRLQNQAGKLGRYMGAPSLSLPRYLCRSKGNMSDKRPTPPQPAYISEGYLNLPRFIIDEFFSTSCSLTDPDTGALQSKGTRLTSSFWKYTLYLLRWLTLPRWNEAKQCWRFESTLATRQFPLRPETAIKWTAAYSVSGVVKVRMGKWTAAHDSPSEFIYDHTTPALPWRAFLQGLDMAENRLKCAKYRAEGNTGAWRVLVAIEVDAARVRMGLPAIHKQWLIAQLQEKDAQGRHIAGTVGPEIGPIFYPPTKRALAASAD